MPQLDIISYQITFPVPGMGYIFLSCWSQQYHRPNPAPQAIIGYSLLGLVWALEISKSTYSLQQGQTS